MRVTDQIFIDLWDAKTYSLELVERISTKQANGENVREDENKLLLLTQWIRIVQDFYNNLADDQVPEDSNFSFNEIRSLQAKIKVLIDIKLPDTNTQMIQAGYWNDQARWDDSAIFSDSVTFS